MSGREDTSEPAGTAGPPSAAPPSFGQFVPAQAEPGESEPEGEQETPPPPVSYGPPPFGPNTPWWAEPRDAPRQPPAESAEEEAAARPPGVLVAGFGVPSIDTRRAVPMEPIKESPGPNFPDTDPDGIPTLTTKPDPPTAPKPTAAEPTAPEPTAAERALTPDAILPPGVSPAQQTTPPPAPAPPPPPQPPTVIVPVYHAEGAGLPPMGPPPGRSARDDRNRRTLVIAGVITAAVLIPAGVFAAFGLSSAAPDNDRAADRPAASKAPARPSAPPGKPPVNINAETTDLQPLSLAEAFPTPEITLGGRFFLQDKASVNHQCGLAASGVMINALENGDCRSVVRATFVNRVKTIAVTTGIAVMPTRKAAQTVNQAGDAPTYEWFRGMPGKRSPNIDQAGGYASSTTRGRYVVYAYATYADGTTLKPGDETLKDVAGQFLELGLRPITARAAGG